MPERKLHPLELPGERVMRIINGRRRRDRKPALVAGEEPTKHEVYVAFGCIVNKQDRARQREWARRRKIGNRECSN